MRGIVRKMDTYEGICDHGYHDPPCCPHSINGVYPSGSPNTRANNRDVIRVGDVTQHTGCPHCNTGIAGGGSENHKCNGKKIHLAGDPVVTGGGTSYNTSSSPDVRVDG